MRRLPPAATLTVWFLTALCLGPAGVGLAAEARPPDLRLEWAPGGPAASAEPLRGRPGETVRVDYRLRNVGGSDAFVAVVEARTALGPVGGPQRLQPGPAAGATIERRLSLALATGMRELCVDARLQTVEPEEPGDPNQRDNRICREVEIEPNGGDERRTR